MTTGRSAWPRPRGPRALVAACAIALLVVPAVAARTPSAQHFSPAGLAPELRTPGPGQVRVVVQLRANPLTAAALHPRRRARLTGRLSPILGAQVRRGSDAQRLSVARHQERVRQAEIRGLSGAATAAAASERTLAHAIERRGGRVLRLHVLTASVTARVPRGALATLARRRDVARVDPAPVPEKHGLLFSSESVGAPSFWAAGFTGGRGGSDQSPADLAIGSDKIQQSHPAFAGVTFQRPARAPVDLGGCDGVISYSCGHGTSVASMAISRGAAGCAECVPADAEEKGVAPGLDTVLDASNDTGDVLAWSLGLRSLRSDQTWLEGAADPAEVSSGSYGSLSAADDTSGARQLDLITSLYGISRAQSAGNDGPGAQTLDTPCIAWNTICTGAYRPYDVETADDTVADFSSRGPTVGGRKKPDLVAVGISAYADYRHARSDYGLWSGAAQGTSLAAPQAAAGAALLAGAGVSDPIAHKAILINSARQGRATPTDPMGTQTGWQPDWGWGALNLDAAVTERANFATGSVPGASARFFRATLAGPGDRGTLVWNRRIDGCRTHGCATEPPAFTLSNLDLQQLDPATGAVQRQSASAIDNVEQTRSAAAGEAIYKVRASSTVDGLPAEPFALAAARPLTALATPQPTVVLTVDQPNVRPGTTTTVSAEVANPSPDLTAEAAQATLSLPPGLELVTGSATQPLGTLAKDGQAGASTTRSWTVRATADTAGPITASVTATRYGETFTGSGAAPLRVDGTPPSPALSAPAGPTQATALEVAWGAADGGVGTASYDVETAVDDGPFSPWLTATTLTSSRYDAAVGHRYRFRARARDRLGNLSDYVASEEVRITAPAIAPEPPVVPRPGPRLMFAEVSSVPGRLIVRGRLDQRAQGDVALVLAAQVRGRWVRTRAKAHISRGAFRARLRLPRSSARRLAATLTASYGGSAWIAPGVLRRRVQLRR